jgi:hypothetical protein
MASRSVQLTALHLPTLLACPPAYDDQRRNGEHKTCSEDAQARELCSLRRTPTHIAVGQIADLIPNLRAPVARARCSKTANGAYSHIRPDVNRMCVTLMPASASAQDAKILCERAVGGL